MDTDTTRKDSLTDCSFAPLNEGAFNICRKFGRRSPEGDAAWSEVLRVEGLAILEVFASYYETQSEHYGWRRFDARFRRALVSARSAFKSGDGDAVVRILDPQNFTGLMTRDLAHFEADEVMDLCSVFVWLINVNYSLHDFDRLERILPAGWSGQSTDWWEGTYGDGSSTAEKHEFIRLAILGYIDTGLTPTEIGAIDFSRKWPGAIAGVILCRWALAKGLWDLFWPDIKEHIEDRQKFEMIYFELYSEHGHATAGEREQLAVKARQRIRSDDGDYSGLGINSKYMNVVDDSRPGCSLLGSFGE
jgi:hypothetical protein